MTYQFDPEADQIAAREAREKHQRDLQQAVKVLMSKDYGRVFMAWVLEGQSSVAVGRLLLQHMEEIHGRSD